MLVGNSKDGKEASMAQFFLNGRYPIPIAIICLLNCVQNIFNGI